MLKTILPFLSGSARVHFGNNCPYINFNCKVARVIATITALSNAGLKLSRIVIGGLIKRTEGPEKGAKKGGGKCYGNDAPPFPRFCI